MEFEVRIKLTSLILATTLLASSAMASEIIITNVATGNGNLGNVSVPGYGSPWTTPIVMTDTQGKTYVVFCDDLNHDVAVGGGQSLPYHFGPVTVNGLGDALPESVSNIMGQIADLGRFDFGKGDETGAIAAQAAIWAEEYGSGGGGGWTPLGVTSSDPSIEALITEDLKLTDNGRGYALGLIADAGQQSQVFGGVPEPATWLTMILGAGLIGAALRTARRKSAALAAA